MMATDENFPDEITRADWATSSACEHLAGKMHDEIPRIIKKLNASLDELGLLGHYRIRKLHRPHGDCIEDFELLTNAFKVFQDAMDVDFSDDFTEAGTLHDKYISLVKPNQSSATHGKAVSLE